MNVELAKTAGFCFGVKRAVETVYEQVEKHSGEMARAYAKKIGQIPNASSETIRGTQTLPAGRPVRPNWNENGKQE